jgi:hypothetical protein
MLGIPGLDPVGLVHTGFALVALLFGLTTLLHVKGTPPIANEDGMPSAWFC